jgi:acetolactate synthase-1/2/3 large subunit
MKLSDYIARQLADWGVRHIFLVTGGGAMHLNDSIGKEARIRYVCNHHEQASAMAAEAYARITGQPGVVNVTTRPGGINALNGVFGAWTDSIPMLVISGQVKRETCMRSLGLTGLRQLGDQEADILSMAESITKYTAFIDDPADAPAPAGSTFLWTCRRQPSIPPHFAPTIRPRMKPLPINPCSPRSAGNFSPGSKPRTAP